MTLLQEIHQRAQERGLRFLLIGGFAVNAHGHGRTTGDLDLAVPRADLDAWRNLIESIGHRLGESNDRFLQFESDAPDRIPIDVMLTNEATFAALWDAAGEVRYDERVFRVVSIEHLIAMKLHVLKQAKLHRFLKDFQDVVDLARVNQLDLRSEKFRALFAKHGSVRLYEQILRFTGQSDR
jgi:hypothetical protein